MSESYVDVPVITTTPVPSATAHGELVARVAVLEEDVEALEAQPDPPAPPDLGPLTQRVTDVEESVSDLGAVLVVTEARIDTLEGRPLPDVTQAELAAEAAARAAADTALDARVDTVEARPVAEVTQAEHDTLTATVTSLSAQVEQLRTQVLTWTPTTSPGVIWTHLQPGADSGARLRNAIAAVMQDTQRRAVRCWDGGGVSDVIDTANTIITPAPGVRIKGPVDNLGFLAREVDQRAVPYRLRFKAGIGGGPGGALVQGTAAAVVGFGFSDLCIDQVQAASQFAHWPYNGNPGAFGMTLQNMQFYGWRHIAGNPTDFFTQTLLNIRGDLHIQGMTGTPFLLRGGDTFITTEVANIDYRNGPAGSAIYHLGSMSKTHMSGQYLTVAGLTRALILEAYAGYSGEVFVTASKIEGYPATGANGALILAKNYADISLTHSTLNFAMVNPAGTGDRAYVEVQSNAHAFLDDVKVVKSSGVSQNVAILRTSGGATARVFNVKTFPKGAWTDKPVVTGPVGSIEHDDTVRFVPDTQYTAA